MIQIEVELSVLNPNRVFQSMINKEIYIYTIFCFLLFMSFSDVVHAQEGYMYRLELKDKGNSAYSLEKPSEFLSLKSLDRRQRQGLSVDSTDLPIDTVYLGRIQRTGAVIRSQSKWVSTVTVYVNDSSIVESLKKLEFIDTLYLVWKGTLPDVYSSKFTEDEMSVRKYRSEINTYGQAFRQISMLNGQLLHEAGFRGEGMSIAVIDGGFTNCDKISAFDQNRIKEVRNFSHETRDPLRTVNDHGTKVLSCMLSNVPGLIVGTAPAADYYLFLTEVNGEEFPVEEDYWITAIEYADSLGIDIANTSLGYTHFNMQEMSHTQSELDGKTILISRAASMAAQKGMLLFCAAGNEGNKSWGKIGFPGDAENIVTVGAVDSDEALSTFSSHGYTADGRVKPDVMAMGTSTAIIGDDGTQYYANGTSFSTPVLCGLGACLWQALPDLSAKDMISVLQEASDRYQYPDSLYGYGIPDVYRAYAGTLTGLSENDEFTNSKILFVDSGSNRLYLNLSPEELTNCRLFIYSSLGNQVLNRMQPTESIDISSLHRGIYVAYIQINHMRFVRKFIKL